MPLLSAHLPLQHMASVPERPPDVARPSPGLELGLEPMAAKTGSGGSVGKMKSGGVRIIISKKKIKGRERWSGGSHVKEKLVFAT
jgi:hypothetical protein